MLYSRGSKKNRSTVIDKINRSPDRAKYKYKVFKLEFLGFTEAVKKPQLHREQ
ncbi:MULTISPECIES: hypothetical protein [unclassified Microcoleus]|uniref:hypothetical protein n=1 Tax=unclassified Microcoleus TaxID=2642155 RepID=UPI002FD5931A